MELQHTLCNMSGGMNAGDGYDIFSPEYRADPWSEWAAVRRAGCPLARSEAWGGSWLPVRYDDIRDIGRDAERFTSRATEVAGPVEVAGGLFPPPLTPPPPPPEPRHDLLSYLVTADIDGEPLGRRHRLGAAFLVLLAGADTTWSAIGACLWHLATHRADRRRLAGDPPFVAAALEELLRFYAPVT